MRHKKKSNHIRNDKVLMPHVRDVPNILEKTRLQSLSSVSKDASQHSGLEQDSIMAAASVNQTNDFEAMDVSINLVSRIRCNLNFTL